MVWNPDYKFEFEDRIRRHAQARDDKQLQAQLQLYYAHNPIDWINDWCVTFDPRANPRDPINPMPRLMPFILFPRQEDFVHFILGCLNDKESGLVEKSRDMGATWLCSALSVWLWLYRPGSVIGWGSRKAEYVDKMDDPKAIFPKIRQILEYLPGWMLPKRFTMKDHALYMRIINPENMSAIIGEAGESMGRGGRTTIYFKDESAHYEKPDAVEAALGDNTDVQIDMSSVNGSANVFYRRRMAGEVWYPDKPCTPYKTRVFIFDWSDNPRKTQEWYDQRKKKAEDEGLGHIFAQEVDRSYSASLARIIINPEWIRAAVDAHIKLGLEGGLRNAGQDIADGGRDKNALAIVDGVILRYADHWGGDAGEAARISIPLCTEWKVRQLDYDTVGVGTGFKVEIRHMRANDQLPTGMRIKPWNGGGSVLDPDENVIPGDRESPLNKDIYHNLKAQSYFRLRARFYKTWRAVTQGAVYPPEQLISIDSRILRLQEVIMELSQPTHKAGQSGKTLVDKKPDDSMSPNLADAIAIAYNPIREFSILDVI